jgi:hypothetical protein
MQKFIFSLIIIVALIYSECFAQEKNCTKGHCLKGDVGYLSFSIGPSIPLGNFADNDTKNTNSGYANTGSKMELNAGFNLVNSVDLGIKLFYSVNGYDASTLTKKLESENPGTTWITSGRSWDIYGGMVGLSYSYPLTKKFVSDFKFQSGIMQSSTPQMTITGSNGSTITEDKKSASSLVYLISVGGHYPLGRLIDAVGSLEYMSSSPTFDNINKVSNAPGLYTNTTIPSLKQNISLLSFNFGCRVKF